MTHRAFILLLLSLFLLVGFPVGAEENNPSLGYFECVMLRTGNQERIFTFRLSTIPVADLEPRKDGLKGRGKYTFWQRSDYTHCIFAFVHEDLPSHPFVDTVRVSIQGFSDVPGFQINDRNGKTGMSGRTPYPYEPKPAQVDYSQPGAKLTIYHHRDSFTSISGCRNCSSLAVLDFAAVDLAKNPKVKIYYQGGGRFLVIHDVYGPVAQIIVSGFLQLPLPFSMYFWEVEG